MKRLNIILVRYLFIFLLFAGLILILFVPVYRYITEFTLNNELSHISSRMEQGIVSLDSVFTGLELIIITHRQDFRFQVFKSWVFNPPDQPQTFNMNLVTLMDLRDSINLALLPYSINVDAGLLFPDGTAVTRRGVYSYPVPFYGSFFQCGDLAIEEWRALLTSNRSLIPAMHYTSVSYASGEAITYSSRWGYMGIPEEIIFFAALPVDDIVTLLADADVAGASYIRMYNAQGELLFSRGNESGGSYHVISRRGFANSIRYEIGVPDSFIAANLQPVRNLIFLFACITAFFVIIISFLFAWRSSLPERNFLERVRPAFTASEGFNVFSGLKMIYHDLADSITGQIETSMRIIETQTALIRTQTIARIKNALSSGDEAAAQIILRDCYAALPKPEDPLIAGLFAGMLSAMLRDLGKELSSVVSPFEPPEYVSGGQEEIFETRYPACFAKICESVQAHKQKTLPAMGREALAYINEHLYDPNLYITMAADHFSISAPTLQKLIKQCTGQTFLNYVEKLRMDKACELLSNSAESITYIARACGFSSVDTFYRGFKRLYGFPPSRLQAMRK